MWRQLNVISLMLRGTMPHALFGVPQTRMENFRRDFFEGMPKVMPIYCDTGHMIACSVTVVILSRHVMT
jgi:hypothetical protein